MTALSVDKGELSRVEEEGLGGGWRRGSWEKGELGGGGWKAGDGEEGELGGVVGRRGSWKERELGGGELGRGGVGRRRS